MFNRIIFFLIVLITNSVFAESKAIFNGIEIGSVFKKNDFKIIDQKQINNKVNVYLQRPSDNKLFVYYLTYDKDSKIITSIHMSKKNTSKEECTNFHNIYSKELEERLPNYLEIIKQGEGYLEDVRYIYKNYNVYFSCVFLILHITVNSS